MTRWRVYASIKAPWQFYARETFFVDAPDAEAAAAAVTARSWELQTMTVTSVEPATPEMEAARRDFEARREEWLARVRRGENPRGLL